MDEVSIDTALGNFVYSWDEAKKLIDTINFPVIIRPSFTLGGTGGSVAYNFEEFQDLVEKGLASSPISEILIEESLICLLYTSPSPRDLSTSRMPSSA